MDGAENNTTSVAPNYRRLRESAFSGADPTPAVRPLGAFAARRSDAVRGGSR